jgi:hypothetical protein
MHASSQTTCCSWIHCHACTIAHVLGSPWPLSCGLQVLCVGPRVSSAAAVSQSAGGCRDSCSWQGHFLGQDMVSAAYLLAAYLLAICSYVLPAACCLLPAACCLLACCMLCAACCLLPAVCCLLSALVPHVFSVQRPACCSVVKPCCCVTCVPCVTYSTHAPPSGVVLKGHSKKDPPTLIDVLCFDGDSMSLEAKSGPCICGVQ